MRSLRTLAAIGLCLVALPAQAEIQYTFSLPEVTYGDVTYAADTVTFVGGPLPAGAFALPPTARDTLNGFPLAELTLHHDAAANRWTFDSFNSSGNPAAGAVLGFFFSIGNSAAPGSGDYFTANAGRYVSDGLSFVDIVASSGTLSIRPVPIPAALWMLVSGLGWAILGPLNRPATPRRSPARKPGDSPCRH